jgi:hypothetical protein
MSPSKNDITGDFILTGAASDNYRDGWERIFGKKKVIESTPEPTQEQLEGMVESVLTNSGAE